MDAHKNFASSTVAVAPVVPNVSTSLTVATGEGTVFPAAPFNATIWPAGTRATTTNAEIVRVTNIAGDVLTIIRAQESTIARSVLVGDFIAATVTAKMITDIEDNYQAEAEKNLQLGYAGLDTSGAVVSGRVPPSPSLSYPARRAQMGISGKTRTTTLTVGTTTGQRTITSFSNFTFDMAGQLISGTGIPATSYIQYVVSPSLAVIAFLATATGSTTATLTTSLTVDAWLTDSFGFLGTTNGVLRVSSAVYEAYMAAFLNTGERTSGYMPIFERNIAAVGTTAAFDACTGTINNPTPDIPYGWAYSSGASLTGSQYAEHTSRGDGIEVFYTAQRTGGATATVTINGVNVGTINSTDGTLAVSPGYSSGRKARFLALNSAKRMTVRITTDATGNTFLLDAVRFCNGNNASGFCVHKGGRSGFTLNAFNGANGVPMLQHIANNQPQMVTIQLGLNDVYFVAPGTSTYKTRLTTAIANIRAQYTTQPLPSIRYIFQPAGGTLAVNRPEYLTDYREAAREICEADGDIAFIDLSEVLGPYGPNPTGDPLDIADLDPISILHPGNNGQEMMARAVIEATTVSAYPALAVLRMDGSATVIPAPLGFIPMTTTDSTAPFGVNFQFGKDLGDGVPAGTGLGAFTGRGSIDGTGFMRVGAYVSFTAAGDGGTWTPANTPGQINFGITPIGQAFPTVIVGGIGQTGLWYAGTSYSTALFQVDVDGRVAAYGGGYFGNSVTFDSDVTFNGPVIGLTQTLARNAAPFLANSTSPATVTGLSIAVDTSVSYAFEVNLFCGSAGIAGTGTKVQMLGTGGFAANGAVYHVDVINETLHTVLANQRSSSLGTSFDDGGTNSTAVYYRLKGAFTCTSSGTLNVRFGQVATSPGTSATVQTNSTFRCEPIT